MADIFNRTSDKFGGSFAADQARITFPALSGGAGGDAGLLVQNMQANYTQQVTRLYEISSPTIYYVGGRTSGSAAVTRVVGPRKLASAFYSTYGDICNAASNTLNFSMTTGCGEASGARAAYTAHFVVIVSIGISIAAADMLINESLQMMFSSFLYS